MSDLDDAMLEHMAYIVMHENRPFCYRDFLHWNDGEKEWRMMHKTFRNKISKLRKDGKAKFCYNSSCAFYTLNGYNFGKPGTRHPMGVTISNKDPIYNMIKSLPFDKQSIHDIHLKFKAPDIYESLSLRGFPKIKVNKAIAIPSWIENNAVVKITVNKNDTVTVIIGCSLQPIPLNGNGIVRFFTSLASAKSFLQGLTVAINHDKLIQSQSVPQWQKWIITRWDFGRDSLTTYKGEKYEITVESAEPILSRIYPKDFGEYQKIRIEEIECPNRTVIDAIQEKLNNRD
jgi:hypothetical protein